MPDAEIQKFFLSGISISVNIITYPEKGKGNRKFSLNKFL